MARTAVKQHRRRRKIQGMLEEQLHEFLATKCAKGQFCSDLIEGILTRWAKRNGYKPKD